jgi:thioredoxin 1
MFTQQGKSINLSNMDFKDEVLKSELPVVVDFWAPWCAPCQMAAPVLEKIAQEYKGRLKVCKVNVDTEQQIAMEYGIMSIPTLNIYKDGKVVDQIIGIFPNYEADLKRKIEPYLKKG